MTVERVKQWKASRPRKTQVQINEEIEKFCIAFAPKVITEYEENGIKIRVFEPR